MLQREHSAILLTFIKLPFVIKIFVLSIFEWLLKSGFTVCGRFCVWSWFCVIPLNVRLSLVHLAEEKKSGCLNVFLFFLCVTFFVYVLKSLPHGTIVCSVITASQDFS